MKSMGTYSTLRIIYSPRYLALNVALAIVYYIVIGVIISSQQFGIVFYAVPTYLLYLLAVTSSVLMTLSVYSILGFKRPVARYSGAVSSAATAVVGGVLGGCGCQGAAFYSVLALAFGGGEAFFINTVVAKNIVLIFIAMCCINIALSIYYINRISRLECKRNVRR